VEKLDLTVIFTLLSKTKSLHYLNYDSSSFMLISKMLIPTHPKTNLTPEHPWIKKRKKKKKRK
jgi:hypothetical protein